MIYGALFLNGCRTCWSYKVLKFAFVADITKFDPDKTCFSQHVLDAICTFSFDERLVMKCANNNNNNNRRLVTLAEHTSDHGRQTNSSTEEKGEQV